MKRLRRSLLACSLIVVAAPLAGAPAASAKDKPPPPSPSVRKTGLFQLDAKPAAPYVAMAVPADYVPTKTYPLLYLMPPISDNAETSKPDVWVKHWSEPLLKRGWIVASPAIPFYDNEQSLGPIQAALKKVTSAYSIDERRIVIGGAYSGATMAWRLAATSSALWVGVLAVAGEVMQVDRAPMKAFGGKPAYVYRGEKDKGYSADMWKADEAALRFAKVNLTVEVKPGVGNDFPLSSLETMAAWADDVWPGTYREKAEAVEKAVAANDVAAGFAALKPLRDEMKKTPYPAFEPRATAAETALYALGRAPIVSAKKLLETDPIAALAEMEAAAKALKGVAPLDKEVAVELAAMRKDPTVLAAIKRRDGEEAAKKLLPKAEEAEAKGDLAKALELFKRIVALGDTSMKDEAAAKVAALEAKAGGGK